MTPELQGILLFTLLCAVILASVTFPFWGAWKVRRRHKGKWSL